MKKMNIKKTDKFNKILCRIVSITMILMMIVPFFQVTFADTNYNFWEKAFGWWSSQKEATGYVDGNMLQQIADIVEVVGTGVIAIATVVLGIRYVLGTVLSIVTTIGKAVALVATVYIGIKFVMSGAEGKSELKQKGIMYIIGVILIFATLNVLTFVSKIAVEI